MLSYVEFCSGGGGMRSGLDAAGWKCALSVDNDADAVAVHNLAHGSAQLADVTQITSHEVPGADVWVAGFPCQPFSSSGSRLGFRHRSGNVFEHLLRLMSERPPKLLLLENVEGLLINKSGHTFAVILNELTRLGYNVSWLLMDLRWFGVPQTRPRLFIIASMPQALRFKQTQGFDGLLPGLTQVPSNAFSEFLEQFKAQLAMKSQGSLDAVVEKFKPEVGKEVTQVGSVFGFCGSAQRSAYASFRIKSCQPLSLSSRLADVVAPNFRHRSEIRSGRYYARGGPTRLCLRKEPISHCVGTSLGGAPLFAVPLEQVRKKSDRADFLEFANWHREQDGLLVMRLRPHRAVKLFGPYTDPIFQALSEWNAGDTRKYKVLGNMVAPVCAKAVAELVTNQLAAPEHKTNGEASARSGNRKGKASSAKPVAR